MQLDRDVPECSMKRERLLSPPCTRRRLARTGRWDKPGRDLGIAPRAGKRTSSYCRLRDAGLCSGLKCRFGRVIRAATTPPINR